MADKPVIREEKYLAYLTGDYKGELPNPITRKEKYLYELCLKGMGGEISPEEIKNAVNEYLEKNPVKPGATTEQAQQIEQNKTDIASLKTETGSLKGDLNEFESDISTTEYVGKTANMYNPLGDDTINGKKIGINGALMESSTFRTSPFYEVNEGDLIYVKGYVIDTLEIKDAYPDISTFDENKNFIERYVEIDTRNSGFEILNGVKYIRISESYYNAYSRVIMLSKNIRLTEVTEYNEGIKKVTIKESAIEKPLALKGKKIATYGDSIVENGGWQEYVAKITGAIVTNRGIGGTRMTNRNIQWWLNSDGKYLADSSESQPDGGILCWESISGKPIGESGCDRIDLIPTDTDFVLVEFGTNDLHQSAPIGTWNDTDNNTFKGAMKLCVERLRTRLPLATIVFITPTSERTDFTNDLGLHKIDYVKAIIESEEMLNIPVINLWSKTSWSVANYENYSADNLHWNDLGKKIAGCIIGNYMTKYETISL